MMNEADLQKNEVPEPDHQDWWDQFRNEKGDIDREKHAAFAEELFKIVAKNRRDHKQPS